ncbi:uncharacterized protein LOC131026979 isoform X2 [Cryptomeria japonica]|uniref:uncharacterized protein LOC131026979 isoform X2 n=1 Tax=Cryptomeria japonica TaxID=3369 RepID=UPI0025AD17DD|nr:uncharacterized protein LOC131026979 isoform X2 [Cryptomeria japonica]
MAKVMGSTLRSTCVISQVTLRGNPARRCRAPYTRSMPRVVMQAEKTVTFSSDISTDIPLYEVPQVSFDQYLSDRTRVFQAIFPDKRRSERLNDKRWDLRGLDYILKPSDFELGVRGVLYSEKYGVASRLKAQMEMSISFVLPPALAVVPEDVLKGIGHSVLLRLLENMKQKVNSKLLSDYREYATQQTKSSQAWRDGKPITTAL